MIYQTSLLMKFAWKILHGGSLWVNFCFAKYGQDKHIFFNYEFEEVVSFLEGGYA